METGKYLEIKVYFMASQWHKCKAYIEAHKSLLNGSYAEIKNKTIKV